MKYKKLTGIILKKQNYKEADQIITCWTKEAGKIRVLAKSLRLPKSRLNYAMHDLSEVEIDLVGKQLPTLIGARPLHQFSTLYTDLKKMAIAFYGAELVMKITADEHPNEQVYGLTKDFLYCLNRLDYSIKYYPLLESFSVKLLDTLGFKIPDHLHSDLTALNDLDFENLEEVEFKTEKVDQLHSVVNKFIEYILERNIKSEPFLITNIL